MQEQQTTFFDLPANIRNMIWKDARRINIDEGKKRLVEPLQTRIDDINSHMNSELVKACGEGEINTIKTLLDLGADPAANCANALLSAVLKDQYLSINYLLFLKLNPFDHPEMKTHLKRIFMWAKQRSSITQDNSIVERLKEHYRQTFSSDIEDSE